MSSVSTYTQEEVIGIFRDNTVEDIAKRYTYKELVSMYLAFYSSKPLSSDNKLRVAQNIHLYIYTMNRTHALLKDL